jgi:hypothetical protein
MAFATDSSQCPGTSGGPQRVDLRCQGFEGDTCGCLSIPSIAQQPYYGCLISGYAQQAQGSTIPLVTLPGVIDADIQSQLSGTCTDTARPLAAAQPCARLDRAVVDHTTSICCLQHSLYLSASCCAWASIIVRLGTFVLLWQAAVEPQWKLCCQCFSQRCVRRMGPWLCEARVPLFCCADCLVVAVLQVRLHALSHAGWLLQGHGRRCSSCRPRSA